MNRNLRALAGALTLALAIVAPVAATTQSVTDSFSVNGTIACTGIPATLDYGALDAGSSSATFTIDAMCTANSPFAIDLSGTDFAKTGGGAPVSKSARHVILSTDAAGTAGGLLFDAPFTDRNFGDASLTDGTPEVTGTAGANQLVRGEFHVEVPGGTIAGSYSGSIVYTVTAS